MPEGDTIFRTAAALRSVLVGRRVVAARAAPGPGRGRVPRMDAVVGSTVAQVESRGKHLLIGFDNGLTLRTHMRMSGSWHRYAPGQPWHRPAAQASVTIDVPGAVAVCFNAPTLELLSERDLERTPALASLGPDLLSSDFDAEAALARLEARPDTEIGEALLDQRALAGIGNVYKSETLHIARIHPWRRVGQLDRTILSAIVGVARNLLVANTAGRPRRTRGEGRGSRLWVYGRAGRPCQRCGSRIQRRRQGALGRLTYWCPRCQP